MNFQNSGAVCRGNAPSSLRSRDDGFSRASLSTSLRGALATKQSSCCLLTWIASLSLAMTAAAADRGRNPCKAGLRHAFQKRLFRGLDRIRGSDMHPDAIEPHPEQPLRFIGLVDIFG